LTTESRKGSRRGGCPSAFGKPRSVTGLRLAAENTFSLLAARIECAEETKADYLVTGSKRHFQGHTNVVEIESRGKDGGRSFGRRFHISVAGPDQGDEPPDAGPAQPKV